MQQNTSADKIIVPWKQYFKVALETLVSFYLASFCIALFILRPGQNWVTSAIVLGLLYVTIIVICVKQLLQTFPIAAMMLIIPIAPLTALILILSLIPLLQVFL